LKPESTIEHLKVPFLSEHVKQELGQPIDLDVLSNDVIFKILRKESFC
jgi:hypothetical protein